MYMSIDFMIILMTILITINYSYQMVVGINCKAVAFI